MIKKIIKTIIIILLIVLLLFFYSKYIGTTKLMINEISLRNQKINKDFDGLKIVHLSDIHYKKIITSNRINNLVEEINLIKPDIVIFTGDLINKDTNITKKDISFLEDSLSKINSKYGKYAVLGDNDYSIDINIIKDIYNHSSFILLNNKNDYIYSKNNNKLLITGINTEEFNNNTLDNIIKDNNIYSITIFHKSDYIDNIKELDSNLYLAGNSINGHINIPYIKKLFIPKGSTNYYEPHYIIDDKDFYISNGIGVSNINYRLFNRPSINLYRINTN